MINIHKLRRQFAIILPCVLVSVFFRLGLMYGFLGSMVGLLIAVLVSLPIASMLLMNPYRQVLEGQGLLCLDQNSTGFIQPYCVKVMPPKMALTTGTGTIKTNYDRKITYQFNDPKNGVMQVDDAGYIHIKLSNKEYNQNRFALNGRPTLLFNSMSQTFINKDFFADREKSLLANHSVLLNMDANVDELVKTLRDFSRHAINQLGIKNLSQILKSKLFIIIMVIIFGLLAFIFFPQIIDTFRGLGGGI